MTMTDTPTAADIAKAERRAAGLLAKAERTDNPHEAEAFAAKAMEIIDGYRLDIARLRGDAGPNVQRHTYTLAGTKYLRASLTLMTVVARHYGVVILIPSTGNSKYPTLVGDKDDIAAVLALFGSLIIQRDRACLRDPVPSGTSTATHRNSFCYGYAYRIGKRLKELREAAVAVATRDGDTMALAVIDRAGIVKRLAGITG